jgi:hypothetical protein
MQTLITKRCAQCSAEFTSLPHYHKLYCSHSCYQKAKVNRRIAREAPTINHDPFDNRLLATLKFPAKEQLDMFAKVVTEDRPVKVIGMNCMWQPPDGVVFVKQPELEENTEVWIMTKREMGLLDVLAKM